MKSVKYFSNNHKKMIIKYYLIQLKNIEVVCDLKSATLRA